MTLLDFPGRVACTVFLGGCEFRCPFCHNADILDMNAPALMEEDELLSFLKTRQGLLDGVAFTGGEPLLRKGLDELFKKIRDLGYKIKLDTNGNHPQYLAELIGEGLLDYVAMDVKNCKDRYGETIGLQGYDTANIDESIKVLLDGNIDYEFRTTVIKQFHDEESFEGIAEWIAGAKNYFLQGFVDRDTVPYSGFEAYGADEMEKFAAIVRQKVQYVGIRGV